MTTPLLRNPLRAFSIQLLTLCLGFLPALADPGNILVWGTGGVTNVPELNTNAIALAGGDYRGIALLADRTVEVWGSSSQTNIAADATDIVSVAAGSSHQLVARSDGSLRMWGYLLSTHQTDISPDATNVVAVAVGTGAQHALVLRKDGTVVDWGHPKTAAVPVGVVNIVSVAAGAFHCLALRSDGRVIAWGNRTSDNETVVPASATNIVAIAATWYGNVALRSDGQVLTWGKDPAIPNQATLTNVVEVAGRGRYGNFSGSDGIALTRDGVVVAVDAPPDATNIMAVAGSAETCMALKAVGPPVFPFPPVRRTVAASQTAYLRLRAVGALPMGYQWSFHGTNLPGATTELLVVTNAQISQSGFYTLVASNELGAITNSDMELAVASVVITNQPTNRAVAVGQTVTLSVGCLGQSPVSYQWALNGTNLAGEKQNSLTIYGAQLTNGGVYSVTVSNLHGTVVSSNALLSVWPILLTQPPTNQVMFRGGTATFSVAAAASQTRAYQWQFSGTVIPGATNSTLALTNVAYEQAGTYSVAVALDSGWVTNAAATLSVVPVAAWGDSLYGQTSVPSDLSNIVAVAVGGMQGLALREDGTVASWGDVRAPGVPEDMTNVVSVAAGGYHNLSLRADGMLIGWGQPVVGRPDVVPELTNVVACSAGSTHSLAIDGDGRVFAWGDNSYGQTNVPSGAMGIVGISAGGYHSLALRHDGIVVAWGRNDYGQTTVPLDLQNVVGVSAGGTHSLALKADGKVVAWGRNEFGITNVPVTLEDVVAVAGGANHCVALQANGTVVAWGLNSTMPLGLTNAVAIAAGGSSSILALIGDGPPVLNSLPVEPLWTDGAFRVSLISQNARVYRLEYKNTLSESRWTALPLVAGNGRALIFTDPTASGTQRFYRIRKW